MKSKILGLSLFLWFSTALWAQSNDRANTSDVKACAALVGDGKLPWSVNSAEFVQPPLTVFVTVGPRDSWRKVTVAVPFGVGSGGVDTTSESWSTLLSTEVLCHTVLRETPFTLRLRHHLHMDFNFSSTYSESSIMRSATCSAD
jgi:hypothetical protein